MSMDSSKDFLRCVYNFLRMSRHSDDDSDDTLVLTEEGPLQVNGHDVREGSEEDTMAALRSATEPIVVHVMRRIHDPDRPGREGGANSSALLNPTEVCGASGMEASVLADMVSVATQTDDVSEEELQHMWLQQQHEFAAYDVIWANGHGNLFSPDGLPPSVDLELADFDYFDAGFDMEYEEVVLERVSREEKVGLTLCYENHGCEEDEITDIFVSEIEPNSIAALDGRVKEGDQILQINETEVHSRQDAIKLFSETGADIRLLIARQILPVDDRYLEEQARYHYRELSNSHEQQLTHHLQGDELTTDTASTGQWRGDKDSGVGRTDESVRNEESSEQDPADRASSNQATPQCPSNDSFTSNSTATTTEGATSEQRHIRDCDDFRQALDQRCGTPRNDDVSKLVASEKGALERADSQSSIERELAALNKEMEKIQMECQQIVDAHKKETEKCVTFDTSQPQDNRSSPNRVVPRMGTRLDYAKQLQLQQEFPDPIWIPRDSVLSGPKLQNGANSDKPNIILPIRGKPSSNAPNQNGIVDKKDERRKSPQHSQRESSCTSAYGTGESCRNTPLSLELGHTGGPSLSLMQNGDNHSENKDQCVVDPTCSVSKSLSNSSVNQITQTPEPSGDTLQELYSEYADVMYTNQANLQHTIMLQQKLFQQKISQQQQQSKSPNSPPKASQREETVLSHHNNNGALPHSNGTLPHSNSTSHRNPQSQPLQNPQIASSRCEAAPLSPYSSLRQMRQNQSASPNNGNVQMEWVVKRRADGSRYITRRPMRSKMLKERAKKISEERSGMTTDDDAMSELKVGRYWSKDDRKRHLEKAREYKRRKQEMLRARMETVRENEEQKREQLNILELSQRKMMRHKSRKMYDDFTTVQEILAHGARNAHAPSETSSQSGATPLLSVTTV